ncbi:MAG: pyrroline-5-carboxylate reductase dimerization domain-containing protein [Brevundimonas sp.]|uniref:pyrroline-5-carboxylate reductase family protein n=1 Tax=Brevundimonas sp. TaxID=1871086 RepID=UPI002734E865|nr:pyrroline-5-carboxylate reductase dimerization domain-containing protein [Brevundimonas sp.]MDP3656973.1 pyrroline-5-carboxylate reductase dimerization domain-containing protein [Brevundimonas sp.]MDZ4108758.1 pyrroline-5-carboxylate reductase dimerization domain-containing protein [Brevundimonas sp.]
MEAGDTPRAVVLVGCGRLGSAILEGWLKTGAIDARDLIVMTPSDKPAAEAARARGARINPPPSALGEARVLVLAVKPAKWREALTPLAADLNPDAVVVSVMAGVTAADIGAVAGRPVARVMPTTAVAQARGVAALWSGDAGARETARGLFAAMADVVDLDLESRIDAATATAGSAPAFIYDFVLALARAGEAEGLSAEAATRLARGALRSAGAGVDAGETLEALIARIASPGGTTRAGLDAMAAGGDLDRAAAAAVKAAVQRARAY